MTRVLPALLLVVLAVRPAHAQTSAPATPPPVVSGLIFGNFSHQLPPTSAPLANGVDDAFLLDRAYLTIRLPAGERLSVRLTTDIYQSSEATANAYTIRAKYAYLQYDAPKHENGAQLMGRIGILQNVIIDHMDAFWPRYLSQAPVERALFFSSADVGIAGHLTLPNKWGEVYGTVVNGPGYTSRERDRFKDVGLRVSLTPLTSRAIPALWQNLTVTAWGYKGATASAFVNGGAGQLAPVGEGLDRSRAGVFVGIRDPRLTLGAEVAQRHDGGELGANTGANPRSPTALTGRLMAAMGSVRPLAFLRADGRSPYGLIARYDRTQPSVESTGYQQPPATSNAYHVVIAGIFADVSPKVQFALDYQEQIVTSGPVPAPNASKGYYLHFLVNF